MALSIRSGQNHDNNSISMSEVLSSIDILTLVAECLANHDLIDLIHFAQVCKTWHHAAAILQRLQFSSMPWLLSFDEYAGRFGLCDFWSSKKNCSHELKISPELRKFIRSGDKHGLPICTSKNGWLLLSKYVRCSSRNTKVEFLFCNPFHNKIIELPCLFLGVCEDVHKFMVNCTHPSLAARNSDCVIAIISTGQYSRLVTCNPRTRNKKWTSHMIYLEHVGRQSWCSTSTYMDGTLYCVFQHLCKTTFTSLMGMFCIAKKDSRVVKWMHSSLQLEEEVSCDDVHLFQSNGELLLATRNFNLKRSQTSYYWRVYHLDPLRKDIRNQLTPIESLGNRALAISTRPSDSVVVVHEAKEFADMIIYNTTTYIRETDDRGSIWRLDKDQARNFMRGSVTYMEPILFA